MKTTGAAPASAGTAPARHRVPARTRLDFWFDGVLLVAYTLAYSLGFTGLAIHEWLGLGIGLALLLHLTLHWDWVVRAHSSEASWLAAPGPVVHRRPPTQIQLARRRAGGGSGLSLSDSGELMRTAIIEAIIAGAVIAASALRRHHRRARRAGPSPGPA